MSRTRTLLVTALMLLLPAPAMAQPLAAHTSTGIRNAVPSTTSGSTGARTSADSLLPVLDDDGVVIPEELIRATMRRPGAVRGFAYPVLLGLLGASLASGLEGSSRVCDIYQPCSDRDKFHKHVGPFAFMAAGVALSFALPTGEVTRLQAIQRIRAARNAAPRETR